MTSHYGKAKSDWSKWKMKSDWLVKIGNSRVKSQELLCDTEGASKEGNFKAIWLKSYMKVNETFMKFCYYTGHHPKNSYQLQELTLL